MKPDMGQPFPVAAINTLQATRWTFFKARLFGLRVEGEGGRVVGRLYRGKLYLTDYRPEPPKP
jgi:hypothetical protein